MYRNVVEHENNKEIVIPLGSSMCHHAIILANKKVVTECCDSSTDFFMDGTFRICPKQGNILNVRSSQVFNVLTERNGHGLLLFSVIMTSRKLALYERVFQKIKEHYPTFNPPNMMADFEASMRKAFKKKFPASRLLGCR
jgi:hypothetical protein